jgi:hypothetical protein
VATYTPEVITFVNSIVLTTTTTQNLQIKDTNIANAGVHTYTTIFTNYLGTAITVNSDFLFCNLDTSLVNKGPFQIALGASNLVIDLSLISFDQCYYYLSNSDSSVAPNTIGGFLAVN